MATETLERAVKAAPQNPTASNRYFLAMCYRRLGVPTRARACYEQAVSWRSPKPLLPYQAEQVATLRAEAEAILGERSPQPPTKQGKNR